MTTDPAPRPVPALHATLTSALLAQQTRALILESRMAVTGSRRLIDASRALLPLPRPAAPGSQEHP